jgi:hypothetical protein
LELEVLAELLAGPVLETELRVRHQLELIHLPLEAGMEALAEHPLALVEATPHFLRMAEAERTEIRTPEAAER